METLVPIPFMEAADFTQWRSLGHSQSVNKFQKEYPKEISNMFSFHSFKQHPYMCKSSYMHAQRYKVSCN